MPSDAPAGAAPTQDVAHRLHDLLLGQRFVGWLVVGFVVFRCALRLEATAGPWRLLTILLSALVLGGVASRGATQSALWAAAASAFAGVVGALAVRRLFGRSALNGAPAWPLALDSSLLLLLFPYLPSDFLTQGASWGGLLGGSAAAALMLLRPLRGSVGPSATAGSAP